MSGVLFVITVPKEKYEEELKVVAKKQEEPVQSAPVDYSIAYDAKSEIAGSSNSTSTTTINRNPTGDENLASVSEQDEIIADNETNLKQIEIKIEEPTEDKITEEEHELPMEKVVSEVIKALNITDAAWSESRDGTHWQITFSMQGHVRCERALKVLRGAELGVRANTSLCVLPCTLHYRPTTLPTTQVFSYDENDADEVAKQSAWSAFVQSVRARQTVAQVVEQIKADAALTFDFFFLLIVAALVAALGLVENSTVFLVASMLISPLMGPIMAGTFGTAIRDIELLKMGIKHELFGLFLVLVIGFLFGLVICGIDESYGEGEWPTSEILSRCDLRSLWIGALIALPSGAAVAIAVLSDNTSSLVGVAISASLLPPAVNAGLLWAMSLIHLVFINDDTRFTTVVKTKVYSENPATELAVNGFISLCLTLVNIICIYIAGILVYKIKEVAPANSSDTDFWKHGIKAIRDFNKTVLDDAKTGNGLKDGNNENLAKSYDCNAFRLNINQDDLFNRIRYSGSGNMTWSPHPRMTRRVSAKEIHGYYRQFSEDPAARKPRLSFPVNQMPGYARLDEESVYSTFHNVMSEGPYYPVRKHSKFTVVPVNECDSKSKDNIN